jgi:hypothetical protein
MDLIYEERIFSGLLAILPGCFGIILLGVFIYNRLSGTLKDPSSPWFLLGIGLFLLLIAVNFAFLTIKISTRGVSARFGIFSHDTPRAQVAGSYEDKNSNVSYGGFGIRLGWVNGKRRLVYNVTNAPRIVLQLQPQNNREFVFSSRHPEAVMKAIKEILGTPQ